MKLSVVIPALNEEHGIGDVLKEIPIAKLGDMDYEVEVIVVDNGSVDSTAHVACMHGATVVVQPMRGYGNAYRAGFAYATGDVVATGDADLTYPFADLPKILRRMGQRNLEFVTTDRLSGLRDGVMTPSHVLGNWLLSRITKTLFRWPYKDSQSGMWIFKRYVWHALDVQSSGMPFSQELKIEAFVRGFRCDEVPIDYRARAGKAKLNTITDGLGNISQLVRKRISLGLVPAPSATALARGAASSQDSGSPGLTPAAAGERDASCVWHQRCYDVEAHSDGPAGERGPHVPLAVLAGANAGATGTDERSHMVVWRAERRGRKAVEQASVHAPTGTSRADDRAPGPARYIGPERRCEACAV
jgi:Glycosyl transferase family 2